MVAPQILVLLVGVRILLGERKRLFKNFDFWKISLIYYAMFEIKSLTIQRLNFKGSPSAIIARTVKGKGV